MWVIANLAWLIRFITSQSYAENFKQLIWFAIYFSSLFYFGSEIKETDVHPIRFKSKYRTSTEELPKNSRSIDATYLSSAILLFQTKGLFGSFGTCFIGKSFGSTDSWTWSLNIKQYLDNWGKNQISRVSSEFWDKQLVQISDQSLF